MKLNLSRLAGLFHGIGHILDVAHSVGEVVGEVPEPYQGLVKVSADMAGQLANLINSGSSVTALPPVVDPAATGGAKITPFTEKGAGNH